MAEIEGHPCFMGLWNKPLLEDQILFSETRQGCLWKGVLENGETLGSRVVPGTTAGKGFWALKCLLFGESRNDTHDTWSLHGGAALPCPSG